MGLSLVTPAATPAVELGDAKEWAGIEGASFDGVMQLALDAAVAKVEELTERVLGSQTWLLTLDAFSDAIELPRGPVLGIETFSYLDSEGNSLAVSGEVYATDLVSVPQWVVRLAEEAWPSDVLDGVNAVSIEFAAGYDADTLPASLRRAVLTLAAAWFQDRESGDVPKGVLDAVAPFRRIRI